MHILHILHMYFEPKNSFFRGEKYVGRLDRPQIVGVGVITFFRISTRLAVITEFRFLSLEKNPEKMLK